jgi:RimJ/RimL family protein N-acetyltransferase
VILGKLVGLRLVEEEDLVLLARWRNDPQARPMFSTPLLISDFGQRAWYEALSGDPTRMQFMIVRLADHAVVGTLGLTQIDQRNQSAEGVAGIVDPQERGQELWLDAARVMLRYAFMDLNLHRIYGRVFAHNESMLRVAAKLGYRQEGIARKAAFANGEFRDLILYGVLREEWLELQDSPSA